MSKTALVIGISGQDGAYLSKVLLEKGYRVHGTSRDCNSSSFGALDFLGIRNQVELGSMTGSDFRSVYATIKAVEPDEIYNLAGQTSVAMSFSYPVETFESIALATINILECLRLNNYKGRFYTAGSSEMFGNTPIPANEETALHPRSPYATAKVAAYHAVINYREAYGLHASTGILFNHESPLRPGRFVTKKIISAAVRIANGSKEKLKLGNIDIHRDWGWAPDYVDAMWRILQQESASDFVIATGVMKSLRCFVAEVFSRLGFDYEEHVELVSHFVRPSDIDHSVGDPLKAEKVLGWKHQKSFGEIIDQLIEAELAEAKRLVGA